MNFLKRFRFHPNDEQDPLEEDILEGFLWIFIFLSVFLVVVTYMILKHLDDNQAWIRREWRLLDGLTKDFKKVNKSVDQIKQGANQVLESELNLRGITQTLTVIEKQWEKKQGKVTSYNAQRCVEGYDDLVANRRGVLRRYVLVFKKYIPIVELYLGFRRIKEEINNQIEQEHPSSIVEILEESRSNVRKLQDRPIEEAKQSDERQKFDPGIASVLIPLECLITKKPRVVGGRANLVRSTALQLELLQAFMEDLGGLRLESEIEKAWVEDAQTITGQALKDINTFLQEAANQMSWFSVLSDYFVLRHKLKKIIQKVVAEVSHLLKTKKKYGFTFIRRDFSNNDMANTSSAVIPSQLADQGGWIPSSQLSDGLRNDLEVFLKDEVSNAPNNMRTACFEILKKMASETESPMEIERIRQIEEALPVLRSYIQVYKIKVMEDSCSVGLEEDVHKLVLELTANSDDQSGLIISIVGMKGIGKTTLAREILHHRSIINQFHDRRYFVSVPRETDEVVQSVGNQILPTQDETSEQDWINKLQNFFEEGPCIVVLDNIPSNEAWEKIKLVVSSDRNTRTILLITTHDKAVASDANLRRIIHHLRLRTGEESWEFFKQMVLPSDEETEMLAKIVVARTGGLPLAILRLGYLLSGKLVNMDDLSVVRVTQGWNQRPWEDVMKTNEEDLQLQPDLKNCLSYFELFPRDDEISARRLVALWVAQGLVQSDNTNGMTQEEVAYCNLVKLIDRNIIQVVERKLNGKVLTCRFPGILRELWLASRTNNTAARSWSLRGSYDRKLAYRFDDEDASFSRRIHRLDHSNLLPEESSPLSIMFFDTREGVQPGVDIRNFLSKAIKTGRLVDLVVLDLERVYKPQLPSIIGNLKKLAYLGLRRTDIEKLPESIGRLGNLQTLDLKYTQVQKLPWSMWKLKKLRNLHLDQRYRIKFMHLPDNLHKLSGVFVDEEGGALINGLLKLNNLRKLRLTIQLTSQLQVDLARYIPQLTNLQSLSLKSINESSEPPELILEPLNMLTKLSSLSLNGKIGRPSMMYDLPQSLTELTLTSSELSRSDILRTLGNYLPELKFLYFLSNSYCGPEMVFSEGFPKLLVLKLWSLPNLEKLVVKEEVMPKLRIFEIRSCMRLRVCKTELPRFSSLPELKLGNMPEEYTAELRTTLQQSKHNLRIRPFTFPPVPSS